MRFLATPDETFALGVGLGERAFPGTVFALTGDLGAGKTALVRGIAAGLGAPGRISSPTFGLVHAHPGGRLPLIHADWYRLGAAEEVEDSGLFELGHDGVLAIEWADRFPEVLPEDHLVVALSEAGEGREVVFRAHGAMHRVFEGLDGR